MLPNLVGDVACGQTVAPDGTVSRLGNLTAWLCSTYTTAQQQWKQVRVCRCAGLVGKLVGKLALLMHLLPTLPSGTAESSLLNAACP